MLCTTSRSPLSGEPSTCLLDTLIVPLPSFLFLAFLTIYIPIKYFLQHTRSKRASYTSSSKLNNDVPDSFDAYAYSAPVEASGTDPTSDRLPSLNWRAEGVLPRWAHFLYIVLVVCLLGLRVLEIARLIAAKMGLGLLPVNVVANLLVITILLFPAQHACLASLRMGRRRELGLALALVFYWAFQTITEAVKVTRLVSYNEVHAAKGTMYPSSDWLLDNACMLGLLVVFIAFEGAHCVLSYRSTYIPGGLQRIPKRLDAISGPKLMASTAV